MEFHNDCLICTSVFPILVRHFILNIALLFISKNIQSKSSLFNKESTNYLIAYLPFLVEHSPENRQKQKHLETYSNLVMQLTLVTQDLFLNKANLRDLKAATGL